MADVLSSPLSSGGLTSNRSNNDGGLLGSIFGGPDPLPGQFDDVMREVPDLTRTADTLKGIGGPLATQGTSTLDAAAHGVLTPAQQAQLGQFRTGLTNQARQQFYNMGRTPDRDTAFISQTADIDAKVNAMAQEQIRSSIQLGLGQLSSSASFFGTSLGFDQAAITALITTGQAQLQQDAAYRTQLTDTFKALGTLFGGPAGGALIGGVSNMFSGGPAGTGGVMAGKVGTG